jgi:hypothetical protein
VWTAEWPADQPFDRALAIGLSAMTAKTIERARRISDMPCELPDPEIGSVEVAVGGSVGATVGTDVAPRKDSKGVGVGDGVALAEELEDAVAVAVAVGVAAATLTWAHCVPGVSNSSTELSVLWPVPPATRLNWPEGGCVAAGTGPTSYMITQTVYVPEARYVWTAGPHAPLAPLFGETFVKT